MIDDLIILHPDGEKKTKNNSNNNNYLRVQKNVFKEVFFSFLSIPAQNWSKAVVYTQYMVHNSRQHN